MKKFPVVSDVVHHEGKLRVVNDRGELTGILPRCSWCNFAIETPGGIRCKMYVSHYAEIHRKRPVDEGRARTWSEPEFDAPYLLDKDVMNGDNGAYTVTLDSFSRGTVSTPTISQIVANVGSSEKDPDLATARVIEDAGLSRTFTAGEIDEIERLVKVTLGTQDIMDVGERVTLPHNVERRLDIMDDLETVGSANRRERDDPHLFSRAVAHRNYTAATRYKAQPRRCFDPVTSGFGWAEEREPVPFKDPGFIMPLDPGPISTHVRCFPNMDHVVCPLAAGKIPFRVVRDPNGKRWEPDVGKIRKILGDPCADPEQIESIVLFYQDHVHDIIKKTRDPRILNVIRKKFPQQASVAVALKGRQMISA